MFFIYGKILINQYVLERPLTLGLVLSQGKLLVSIILVQDL